MVPGTIGTKKKQKSLLGKPIDIEYENPLYVWDNTVKWHNDDEKDIIIEWCKNNCKKWGVQLEEGTETMYKHWQLKVSLAAKKRENEIASIFPLKKCHWTKSSKNGMHTFSYPIKTATRIAGPWTDQDEKKEMKFCKDMIPVRDNPKKCQLELEEFIDNYDKDIIIHLVVDPMGRVGKSSWGRYMNYKKKGAYIPLMKDGGMMINYIKSTYDGEKAFIINIARDVEEKQYKDLWTTLENLKEGTIWDWRHKGSKEFIDPPCIIVLANKELQDNVSKGRLMKWLIIDDELWEFEDYLYRDLLKKYENMPKEANRKDFFFKKRKYNEEFDVNIFEDFKFTD